MLSRVAENLYWLGRYVERAENTARIVNVNANLLLDVPRGIAPGWEPLVEITGSEELYRQHYADHDERSVVRFLVGDTRNAGSILSSLAFARENARTIRDFIPREVWEQINELYLFARESLQSGLSKRGRYAYLKRIILGAQSITGIVTEIMNHDEGYRFFRIGVHVERADMTTRSMDVRSATLLPDELSGLRPFETIQWMSVLKSLSGYQMYRRKVQVRVRGASALRFLLQDDEFPRAVTFCVNEVQGKVSALPRNEAALRAIGRLQRTVQGAEVSGFSREELHEFIDQLQIGLAQVHDEIARTWFLLQPEGRDAASAA